MLARPEGLDKINEVRFLGSILWTDFALFGEADKFFAMQTARQGMTDFSIISNNGRRFTPEDAIRLHEETLAVRERVLGAEHPDTLVSRNNLANAYQQAGRTEEAMRLYEETLAVRERVLGLEHPDTLVSRNNLANAYQDAGRTEEADRIREGEHDLDR